MNNSKMIRNVVLLIVIAIAGIAVYKAMTMPDTRTPIERIGDAADEMKSGATNAARQLEDRTMGDKVKDAVQDMKSGAEDAAKEIENTVKDATKPTEQPAR